MQVDTLSALSDSGTFAFELAAQERIDVPDLVFVDIDSRVASPESELELRVEAREFVSPATYVARLEGGVVLPHFLVGTADGAYVRESLRTLALLPRLGFDVDHQSAITLRAPIRRMAGTVVAIGAQTNANYFHWLLESVSRVAMQSQAGPLTDCSLLVPPLTASHRASLELAGVTDDRLVELSDGEILQAETVMFVSRGLGNIHSPSKAAIKALRDMVGVTQALRRGRRRLYIARGRARRRHLVGESDLIGVLTALGFETLFAEEMTIAEQVACFGEASVIAGAHGAGLANMVFAPPGAAVLEIQPEGQDFSGAALYRFLASACGHGYGCVVAPLHGESAAGTCAPDPDRVLQTAEAFLAALQC